MKLIKLFFYCASLLIINFNLYSQDESFISEKKNEIEQTSIMPNFFEFGFAGFNLNYKEHAEDPSFKSEESGFLPGLYIGTSTNQYFPCFVSVYYSFITGNENYDGGLKNLQTGEITPHKDITGSTFQHFEIYANYRFISDERMAVTPFFGFSFREWERILGKNSTNPFTETYAWSNYVLGWNFNYRVNTNFDIGFSSSANIMFNGTINIQNVSTLQLGELAGYKISTPVSYKTSKTFKLIFEPYYEHYAFDMSNIFTFIENGRQFTIWEPSSKTFNLGFKLGARITF